MISLMYTQKRNDAQQEKAKYGNETYFPQYFHFLFKELAPAQPMQPEISPQICLWIAFFPRKKKSALILYDSLEKKSCTYGCCNHRYSIQSKYIKHSYMDTSFFFYGYLRPLKAGNILQIFKQKCVCERERWLLFRNEQQVQKQFPFLQAVGSLAEPFYLLLKRQAVHL